MDEEQWQQLIAALPANRQTQPPATKDSFRLVFLLYAALFAATHFLLGEPTDFIFFNLLAQGGYNSAIALHGDVFRTLSYSWVHASDAHFWSNLIALMFIAQVLGKSFSNTTLACVIITTAIASGILGKLTRDYSVLVGASGAIMGVFGFLFAAQRNRDRRLNPLARIARQKILYLLLFIEFCLSLKYAWYGGMVHIAGVATGYGMYWLREKTQHSPWQLRGEYATLALGTFLFLSWATHTY